MENISQVTPPESRGTSGINDRPTFSRFLFPAVLSLGIYFLIGAIIALTNLAPMGFTTIFSFFIAIGVIGSFSDGSLSLGSAIATIPFASIYLLIALAPAVPALLYLLRKWPRFRFRVLTALIIVFLVWPFASRYIAAIPALFAYKILEPTLKKEASQYLDIPLQVTGERLVHENPEGGLKEKNYLHITLTLDAPTTTKKSHVNCDLYSKISDNRYTETSLAQYFDALKSGRNDLDLAFDKNSIESSYKHNGPYLITCHLISLDEKSPYSTKQTQGVGELRDSCGGTGIPIGATCEQLQGSTGPLQNHPKNTYGYYPLTTVYRTKAYRKEELSQAQGEETLQTD